MQRFRILLVALLFVILFTVLIEYALEYRIKTSDGVESSLWTILANSLWRKSRTFKTTTSSKSNFSNNSSRKPKFYTTTKKVTTTSKLKDSNTSLKIDIEPKCKQINKTENFTRFSIGELKIHHPELLIFEYLDMYPYGLVEFVGESSKDFPQLKINAFDIRFHYPFYYKDLDGGEIICCAKDCSNAESYVNKFCPSLKFKATWSYSIKWEFELRKAPNKSCTNDIAYQNAAFELTIVRNTNSSFVVFDLNRMKPDKDLMDEVRSILETNSTILNQRYKERVDKYQVAVTLSAPSQNYWYKLPFNYSWLETGLFDKTNCNARGIWILPFQNTC